MIVQFIVFQNALFQRSQPSPAYFPFFPIGKVGVDALNMQVKIALTECVFSIVVCILNFSKIS